MNPSAYVNQIEKNLRFRDLYERDFVRRLQFARDNGCNTAMLTGNGEPLANRDFLKDFAHWNQMVESPFRWIELQTSGVFLNDEYLRFLRNTVGVATMCLSVSDVLDPAVNAELMGTPAKLRVDIEALCAEIKRYDFNLRLSLNMTDAYEQRLGAGQATVDALLDRAQALGANQLTFRQLYAAADAALSQDIWVREHSASKALMGLVADTVRKHGRALEALPFGAVRYSVRDMSVVVDDDCMSAAGKPVMKYLILRPDCKIYTKWDDRGSLLF